MWSLGREGDAVCKGKDTAEMCENTQSDQYCSLVFQKAVFL